MREFASSRRHTASPITRPGGEVFPGLCAAAEVAGSGGGGMHGHRSLEGTFLDGYLSGGRVPAAAL